jgi:hypothetical protein
VLTADVALLDCFPEILTLFLSLSLICKKKKQKKTTKQQLFFKIIFKAMLLHRKTRFWVISGIFHHFL